MSGSSAGSPVVVPLDPAPVSGSAPELELSPVSLELSPVTGFTPSLVVGSPPLPVEDGSVLAHAFCSSQVTTSGHTWGHPKRNTSRRAKYRLIRGLIGPPRLFRNERKGQGPQGPGRAQSAKLHEPSVDLPPPRARQRRRWS